MKVRLDVMLAERGLAESREKAQALVLAGEVLVDGVKARKPGQSVSSEADLKVLQREDDHRAGEQNDDGEVDPTHGWLLIVDQETAGRGHSACYTSERSRRRPKPSPIQPTPAMMRSMPRNRPRI